VEKTKEWHLSIYFFWQADKPVMADKEDLKRQLAEVCWQHAQLVPTKKTTKETVDLAIFANCQSKANNDTPYIQICQTLQVHHSLWYEANDIVIEVEFFQC
jgi:hypothetical protein